jgi:hypothetical protein
MVMRAVQSSASSPPSTSVQKRDAVAQHRNIDSNIVHFAELHIHIDDFGERRDIEPSRALECISAAIEESPGHRGAAQ